MSVKRTFVTAVGAIVLAVGIWALFSTVEGDGISNKDGSISNTVPCGIAFTGHDEERQVFDGFTNCAAAVSDRQLWAWPLAAVGAIAVVGGVFVKRSKARREQAR
ncbi:hypothetical protein L3Q67_00915 [Saccharothrix sp. AJ9571]|nr:hypothetical protein L3Q67_00915 [Saccharothrix sp. AJ9571]